MNVLREAKRNAREKLYSAQAKAWEKAWDELYYATKAVEDGPEFPGREDVVRKLYGECDKINRKACKLKEKSKWKTN